MVGLQKFWKGLVGPQKDKSGMITYDAWRKKYIRQHEGMLYVAYNADGVSSPKDAVTVSEAIGYGMLISVMVDNRADFDGLLAFYEAHQNAHGLMCWQQVCRGGKVFTNPDPDAGGQNCATDGDADAAYALLLAARQWKCEAYKARAISICKAFHEWCIHHETHVTTLGDWCRPGMWQYGLTRASDYMLTHFVLFAQEDAERRKEWTQVFEATVATIKLQQTLHPTGLVADFLEHHGDKGCYLPVTKKVLERNDDPNYSYNACRIPWRLSVYYWETRDARILPALKAMQAFFEGQPEVFAGYKLDGTPLADYTNICFLAPVWCLYKVLDSPGLKKVANKIGELTAAGHGNYYGETMELIGILQLQRKWLSLEPVCQA
ncbi:hypothetical protein WJX72_000078 [[Myrmecia] bisecta]|uniref:Cellulase n=1 Tax=[Myrmecia] bisecta TaxID=41462 RepID=A0AAW1PA80_9CHLO